eukprot:gene4206-4621_t
MYFQLFIISRSGGLVYSKALSSLAPNLSSNDCLRLGSTFHGLHAITTQIAPVVSSGIERLETDSFVLQCLQTLTGTKFVVTASPMTPDLEGLLQGIYELYTDYVLKNPFYEVDMPIRCDLFNKHLDRFIQRNIAVLQRKKGGG